jgi:hypothetical protein
MKILDKVLILGTGAVTVQIAVNLKTRLDCTIGIAGRISLRSKKFFNELSENKNTICVKVQNNNHYKIAGECSVDYSFMGYHNVTGEWDTIVLSVTNDAYISVIKQIDISIMKYVRNIILVTPAIGSNKLVCEYLKQTNYNVKVVSLSTYYASTRGYDSSVKVLTHGVKKKIYIGSEYKETDICDRLSDLLQQLGIATEISENAYEAESKNISIYVHPPLFMNDNALDIISGSYDTVKYAYKFYPEGPITQYAIHDMVNQWKEISEILKYFNAKRFNLLRFMNDDNYPVMTQSLSRDDIDNFPYFCQIKQEYLVYIRYTSLLIDPFSIPDKKGRYFDFSAVPILKAYKDQEGCWYMPRIPKEDYYRLRLLQGMANITNTPTPTIDKFIITYEKKLCEFKQTHVDSLLSDDFIVHDYSDEISAICAKSEIEGVK